MITRENYEAWFLDFAEGNLSVDSTNELYDFLEKNPDLNQEFEEISLLFIEENDISYNGKESLKQKVQLDRIEGLNDFELLSINKLEGNSTEVQGNELNSMIHFSQELRNEYKVFEKTKLKADSSIVYTKKKNLKKREGIIIPMWIRYASSIAAIGLIVFFVTKVINHNNNLSDDFSTKITQNKAPKNNVDKSRIENIAIESTIKTDSSINKSIKEKIFSNNLTIENSKIQKITKLNKFVNINPKLTKTINNQALAIDTQDETKIVVPIAYPERSNPLLLKFDLPKIIETKKTTNRQQEVLVNNTNYDILSPKQFLIKSVKIKLEIDDNNYNSINTLKLVSATLKKSKIGNIDFNKSKDTGKKYLAINIGRFGIERSWNSN